MRSTHELRAGIRRAIAELVIQGHDAGEILDIFKDAAPSHRHFTSEQRAVIDEVYDRLDIEGEERERERQAHHQPPKAERGGVEL